MAANLPTYAEHLLPATSTPFEKIISAVAENRIASIPAPINLVKHPYDTPPQFLAALAYEVGVDIWNEDWADVKKRKVIADTIRLKRILGTIEAIGSYIEIEDGKLIDYVVPPQTPFVSKALSDADYEEWLGQLPQIRVYYGNERSTVAKGQSFVGVSFIGVDATITPDKGRDLLGRHAFLYDPSTQTQTRITLADLGIDTTPGAETISEQVYVPGTSSKYEAYPDRFVGNCYVAPSMVEPRTVSYTLTQDTSQQPDIGQIVLALGASFEAATTRYDRVGVTGAATPGEAFIGSSFIGASSYAMASDAEIDFYDRIFLADPTVPAPVTVGTTYIGHSRLQMQAYRAELLIDAQESAPPTLAIEGRFIGNCFVAAQDNAKRDRILNAVELAMSGRDRAYVDFQVTEVITFGDAPAMDGSLTFGQRIPRVRL